MRNWFKLLVLAAAMQWGHSAIAAGEAAAKDYDGARDAIVRHIENLGPALEMRARSQERLQGMVTAVDERRDRITVRLKSDSTADFRVQDALIFNAVRFGDQVELTVETIDGARTIVGLRKE